jgi:hypothetical protein
MLREQKDDHHARWFESAEESAHDPVWKTGKQK